MISELTDADTLTVKGTKALTYLVTCPEKQVVLSVLCSLLNTVSGCSAPVRLTC